MTSSLITHLVQSYGYYAVFALIALESLGIPLPGETALIAAGLYAGTTHHLHITVLAAVAASAAVIGDNAGYWTGNTGGRRLAERYGRYVRLDHAKLKVGRYLFARHGVKVVFFGRFIAVLRTYDAFFAGVSKMRWPRFLAANAAGGLLWAGFYAFGTYALGSAAASVGNTITIVGYAVTGALTVATILLGRRTLRRLEQRAEEDFPEEQPARTGQMHQDGHNDHHRIAESEDDDANWYSPRRERRCASATAPGRNVPLACGESPRRRRWP
jgi:membrane protein DedA with SNARE-associated domain